MEPFASTGRSGADLVSGFHPTARLAADNKTDLVIGSENKPRRASSNTRCFRFEVLAVMRPITG